MQFVHFAPRKSIPLIVKNGIRTGDGQRGKGVYCMPLYWVSKLSVKNDSYELEMSDEYLQDYLHLKSHDFERKYVDTSAPIRMSDAWKKVISGRRTHQLAAVVFTIPEKLWPVRLYIETFPGWEAILRMKGPEIANRQKAEAGAFVPFYGPGSINFIIRSQQELLHAVNNARLAGWRPWSPADWSMEVVVDGRIPAKCISRFEPYYQSNKEFKNKRQKNLVENDGG